MGELEWIPAPHPYADDKVWLVSSQFGSGSGRIRASAEGYLPRIQWVPRESGFDFTDSVSMKLRVRAEDRTPISDSRVDVYLLQDDGGSELLIASYRADAAGELEMLGDPETGYAVYAQAPGFG